ASAMNILRSRIYDAERRRIDAARSADRREKVGSGDRSERIRTYNFPQGRVTDHRINLTLYKLPQVIAGEALSELIDAHHRASGGAARRPGCRSVSYAAPMRIPTASTMAPPSTIWNTACRKGVSIYRARMKAMAHSSKKTTSPAIAVAIQNAFGQESGTR